MWMDTEEYVEQLDYDHKDYIALDYEFWYGLCFAVPMLLFNIFMGAATKYSGSSTFMSVMVSVLLFPLWIWGYIRCMMALEEMDLKTMKIKAIPGARQIVTRCCCGIFRLRLIEYPRDDNDDMV